MLRSGLIVLLAFTFSSTLSYKYPFQNPALSWDQRVDDLVSRMTLQEIVQQTYTDYPGPVPAIPRLGVRPFIWISECLRGQVNTNSTQWPQALGLAATFSPDVIYNMSTAISYEARAHWNINVKNNKYITFYGLNCFSPVINMNRHPLWGRNQETYGEDPFMTGTLGAAFIAGIQGDHPRYRRASGTCKHLAAYAGPDSFPIDRYHFNAKVTLQNLHMTFLPTFRRCLEAEPASVMCSYNAVNGIPSCVNSYLMTDVLRKGFGFDNFVISDDGAVIDVVATHKYYNNSVDCVAASVKAGCNIEIGTLKNTIFSHQLDALKAGKLTEQEIRENVKPVLRSRFRLGEFDPVDMNPYNYVPPSVILSDAHRELARRAAMMSIVLLKNDKNTLPLPNSASFNKVAIVGPFANDANSLYGDYRTNILPKYLTTPWQSLKALGKKAELVVGCQGTPCKTFNESAVKNAVRDADLVIICVGTGVTNEGESNDRKSLSLPGQQNQLVLAATNPFVKVIVIVFTAGPVDIGFIKYLDAPSAILQAFYPGEATGRALYGVLTASEGPESIPSGRLPMTWPLELTQVPPITDYGMQGHTYRYFKGEPLYPFGYGLSYSNFSYMFMNNPSTIKAGEDLVVSATLVNNGPYDADEVVQLYMSWDDSSLPVPKIQLGGFQRVRCLVNRPCSVAITIRPDVMSVWRSDSTGLEIVPGSFKLYLGGQQPNMKTQVPSNILTSTFTITA